MSDRRDPARSPAAARAPAAAVDLDLAFSVAEALPPELLEGGGTWLDPLKGEEAWQELLAHWLAQLRPELPPALQSRAYSLGLSLVDDAEIAALNREWRHKDGPTDVLAFAAQDDDREEALPMPAWSEAAVDEPVAGEPDADSDGAGGGWQGEPLELGDIVISVETALRQAGEQGHAPLREVLFLASHGLLHLLGWDHPDEAGLAAMLARQDALLTSGPPGSLAAAAPNGGGGPDAGA